MCKQYGYIYTCELRSAILFMVTSVDSQAVLTQTRQCDTNDSQAWFWSPHVAGTTPPRVQFAGRQTAVGE